MTIFSISFEILIEVHQSFPSQQKTVKKNLPNSQWSGSGLVLIVFGDKIHQISKKKQLNGVHVLETEKLKYNMPKIARKL